MLNNHKRSDLTVTSIASGSVPFFSFSSGLIASVPFPSLPECISRILDMHNGVLLLPFLDTDNARELRRVSKKFRQLVEDYKWDDFTTRVVDPRNWRVCFPKAVSCNFATYKDGKLYANTKLNDSDLVPLHGLKRVNLSGCIALTDAAFANFAGVPEVHARACHITNAGLPFLHGAYVVDVSGSRITDAGLKHLCGVRELDVSDTKLTGSGFVHLPGIVSLTANGCRYIKPDALKQLEGISCLMMIGCRVGIKTQLPNVKEFREGGIFLERMVNYTCNDSSFLWKLRAREHGIEPKQPAAEVPRSNIFQPHQFHMQDSPVVKPTRCELCFNPTEGSFDPNKELCTECVEEQNADAIARGRPP
jgi:hypothetical protein